MHHRVIVVGAGIVGVSCAAYLRRDGHEVILVDREGPAAGASRGNAGALSPTSCVPLAMPGVLAKVPSWITDPDGPLVIRPAYLLKVLPWLARFLAASRPSIVERIADGLRALHANLFDDYAPLIAEAGCASLIRRSGCLTVYSTQAAFAASHRDWEMRRNRGGRVDVLDRGEIRQIEPSLSDRFQCGVLLPEHGFVLDPQELVTALFQSVIDRGGRFVRGEATRLSASGNGAAVHFETGEDLVGDRLVLAAGAWSGRLLASIGAWVPLETQRGYHVTLPSPSVMPRLPVVAAQEKIYLTPMKNGLRIAGTVEFNGLDAPPNRRRAGRLLDLGRRVIPQLDGGHYSEWMGHRPCLPDSLPVIGPVPGAAAVIAAFGHGHNGMSSGAMTGRLVADLLAGRAPAIDITPFRVDRF